MKRTMTGFTLIELMVVVAIIGVLSAIGIPLYQGYVQKSELASGTATLRGLLTKTEVYYLDNGSFPTQLSDINTTSQAGSSLGNIQIQSGNQLVFAFDPNNSSLNNASVIFSRSDTSGWSCTVSGASGVSKPKGCQ